MRIFILVACLWLATSPLESTLVYNTCFAKDLPYSFPHLLFK